MTKITTNTNPEHKHFSEFKDMGGGLVAHRYSLWDDRVAYAVYRRTPSMQGYSSWHSARDLYPDCWLGDITTQDLPAVINAMPGWKPGVYWPQERIRAVDAWRESQELLARAYIYAAWPEDFAGKAAPVAYEDIS